MAHKGQGKLAKRGDKPDIFYNHDFFNDYDDEEEEDDDCDDEEHTHKPTSSALTSPAPTGKSLF